MKKISVSLLLFALIIQNSLFSSSLKLISILMKNKKIFPTFQKALKFYFEEIEKKYFDEIQEKNPNFRPELLKEKFELISKKIKKEENLYLKAINEREYSKAIQIREKILSELKKSDRKMLENFNISFLNLKKK